MSAPLPPVTAWAVVLPVKPLAAAKSRLGDLAGDQRGPLALAMALDTVTAALTCPRVAGVLVVTDDEDARTEVARLGALVVRDAPDRGLNPALEYGAEQARERITAQGVAALSADLPALRPGELATALDCCARHSRAFVSDAAGTGTTLLTAGRGTALMPRFGKRSRAAHRASGAHEVTGLDLWSVRRDVDTEVDLYDAVRLGTGPRTARIAELLGVSG